MWRKRDRLVGGMTSTVGGRQHHDGRHDSDTSTTREEQRRRVKTRLMRVYSFLYQLSTVNNICGYDLNTYESHSYVSFF